MDFLKILMLYMSLTAAAGIQGAEPPANVPTPTPTVTAQVETVTPAAAAQETPAPTAIPTAGETPVPTAAPEPTITPNRAYSNLAYGARGDAVRKLQKRLYELGYLTGNIDGSYGYQTRNAVMHFQEVHGLAKDGVAGRMTQTILYESDNVIPNPARYTATPVPTATPGPDGTIPQPDDPSSLWSRVKKASVMVNGEDIIVLDHSGETITQRVPGVWTRGEDVIVCVSDIVFAVGDWDIDADNAEACVLSTGGYTAEFTMTDAARASRKDADAYCESYTLTVNGEAKDISVGAWMYMNGEWYATTDLLITALNADLVWDEEEGALIIRVTEPELLHPTD